MQDYPASESAQPGKRLPGLVDDIVVENKVNGFRSTVAPIQMLQKGNEQGGVLSLAAGIDKAPRSGIESPGQIPFPILTWRDDQGLLALLHVGQPDSGIEIDVGFIHVEDFAF